MSTGAGEAAPQKRPALAGPVVNNTPALFNSLETTLHFFMVFRAFRVCAQDRNTSAFAFNHLLWRQSVLFTLVGSPSWVVKRDGTATLRIRLSTQELPGFARKNPESDPAAILGYIIVDRTSDCSQVSG